MSTLQTSSKSRADELFQNVRNLPTLPPIVQKILASMNDPGIGAKHLGQIIINDQSITALVIRLVNSSYFGLRGKIESITNAVTLLGFSRIRQVLLGVSICGKFKHKKLNEDFSGESFWGHSIATAIIARQLCRSATSIEPDIGYTVGLVHDIGKLLLLEFHEDLFLQAIEKARKESITLHCAELAVTGTDHAEIANWLFNKWNFPRTTRRAVKNHHFADINAITPVSEDALTGVTYFANQMAHKLGLGSSGNNVSELDEAGFKKFFGNNYLEMGIDKPSLEKEVQLHLDILGISAENAPSQGKTD